MKIGILITLMITNIALFGQGTESLIDTNKLWSNFYQMDPGGPTPNPMTTNFIKYSGDTTISSISYKKIFQSSDSAQLIWTEIGFIREDSLKKVFCLFSHDSIEKLLYDFNAEIGDSINVLNAGKLVVDSIDSVFIFDRYKKRLYLSRYNCGPEEWIEGIGSLCGVLKSGTYCMTGAIYRLLCFHENDTLKYINQYFNDCYINTVGINEISTDNIRVSFFPNPVSSSSVFKIYNLNSSENTLEIYSVSGQIFKNISIDSEVTINKSDFQSGLYIYRLITKSNIITGKFEVE